MIEFSQPWFLSLLVALPVLALVQRRSLASLGRSQRYACLGLRSLLLVLLALAMAGLRVLLPSHGVGVIFLLDRSASISSEAESVAKKFIADAIHTQRAGDRAGIAMFAKEAQFLRLSPGQSDLAQWPASSPRDATHIGSALDFASAHFPSELPRRIILLSDGNDTQNTAMQAVRRLAENQVEIWTVPLENPKHPEVLLERVEVPAHLKAGEAFDLTSNIRSTNQTSAKVRLYQGDFLVAERDIQLSPGNNLFTVPSLRPEGSFVEYELHVSAKEDTSLENNRGRVVASLRGEPRVLIVDAEPDKLQPLAEALRAARIQVEIRDNRATPRTIEDLQQYDLCMIGDLSAHSLTREQMELLQRWVRDFGGGFVLLGGENSFGAGGYFHTPIEQMLPVRMEHDDHKELPSVALLIVLDRSGSMTAEVSGKTKMSLAAQGATLALQVLGFRDYFGVLAVDTRPHTIAPLARYHSKEPVAQNILGITAGGGGIYIYTSLSEAFRALRGVDARIKHVILFSDAADAEEKNAGELPDGTQGSGSSLELVSKMVASKITISVVALGEEGDKDTAFLRQLAERGRGRFYLTNDATNLPQIFSTETIKAAQSSLVEEPTLAIPKAKHAAIEGIDWDQSPPLLGYNATKAKPTAEILLSTERGEPLLATWRYGLGQTAAFMSDAKAQWSSEWIGWPGYGKFWTQITRAILRKNGSAVFTVARREIGDSLELTITALTPSGAFRNRLPIQITALAPEDSIQTVTAIQTEPGSYRAVIHLPNEGTTVLQISSPDLPDGGLALAHTRSYPREFLTGETNEGLLKEIAGIASGRFAPNSADVFSAPARPLWLRKNLTYWLIGAVLVLMPLDIFLRRRVWKS